MPITSARMLQHMTWANAKVFSSAESLPDEAFGEYLANPEFSVGRILQHIVEGAEWYAFCLNQNPWRPRVRPSTASDVAPLLTELQELDALILTEAQKDDEVLHFEDEHGEKSALRSTIIFQAIHHATEHRAQLVDILELKGYSRINLDDLDLWAFEVSERTA